MDLKWFWRLHRHFQLQQKVSKKWNSSSHCRHFWPHLQILTHRRHHEKSIEKLQLKWPFTFSLSIERCLLKPPPALGGKSGHSGQRMHATPSLWIRLLELISNVWILELDKHSPENISIISFSCCSLDATRRYYRKFWVGISFVLNWKHLKMKYFLCSMS